MKPNRQKLASLAHEICTLWFQFFGAVFASKGYPFKNILEFHIKVKFLQPGLEVIKLKFILRLKIKRND